MAFHVKKKALAKPAVMLLALMAVIISCVPAYAAEPSVTWKNVSQGINSSDQYVYDGTKTDPTMSDAVIQKSSGVWGYISNGKVDTSKYGIYPNCNGWWFVKYGWVDFSVTGVSKVRDEEWYSFAAGKRLITDHRTALKNDYGWWYLEDGKVNFDYQGFVQNENGVWWAGPQVYPAEGTNSGGTTGMVNLNAAGIEKDTRGIIEAGDDSCWYYVSGGRVDFSYTGVAKNYYGWFYVENGKVNFDYTGIAANSLGIWYVEDGKVTFNYTGYYHGYHFVNSKAQ